MWLTREDGTLEPVATCDVAEAYNQPRQRLPQAYIQNANVDVFWTRVVHERGSQTGSRIGAVVEQDIHDIDTTNELRAAARGRPKELHGKVFVVDIDGVLATITPQNDYNVAEPIRANIEAINRLYEMGNRILLFTARGSMTGIDWAEATRRQMDTWGVKYHDLRLGKPAADYYIDDRLWAIEEVVEWVMGTSNAPAERKS
jgi:CMP-N,N'-diacetyllegionaminic acid synthase